MDLNEVAVFVKVVQAGSFTGAAQILAMPKSTVSAKISALETRLGVQLIRRTTRHLNLTESGESYFHDCVKALEEIESAENAVITAQAAPQGVLKITASADAGVTLLPDILTEFTKQYPQVAVELILTNRVVDLIGEGVDVALRAGPLKDSGLIAKKVGQARFRLFASPTYLKSQGTPRTPEELKSHQCIQFARFASAPWKLQSGRDQRAVSVTGRVRGDDFGALRELAIRGHGIALLPTMICRDAVEKRHLVLVLPAWYRAAEPFYLVHPGGRFVTPKVRAFVQVAHEKLSHWFAQEEA